MRQWNETSSVAVDVVDDERRRTTHVGGLAVPQLEVRTRRQV
ncbi:MAG: hypothetical protein R2695_10115 [Acidimicrobiales bacterium]